MDPENRDRVNRQHFRDVTEVLLLCIRSTNYDIIESCSAGPYLELFARGTRRGWTAWGNQAEEYAPTWKTYPNHSASGKAAGGKRKQATLFDM